MLRMLFEKTGDSVWISHLDLMRVFQRAFRRAGLILKHSQGFTPRAIVSIALPLSVGIESKCELLDFELEDGSKPDLQLLNEKLPAGIRILDLYEAEKKVKEITHLRAVLRLTYDKGVPTDAEDAIAALFAGENIMLEKHSRKGETLVDIRPMVIEQALTRVDGNTLVWEVVVCAQNPSLNPQLLVTALERYAPHLTPDEVRCSREEIYDKDGVVFR